MKYTDKEFVIDSDYYDEILNKVDVFRSEVKPEKAVHIILVIVNGLKRNGHSDIVQNTVTGDDLFT